MVVREFLTSKSMMYSVRLMSLWLRWLNLMKFHLNAYDYDVFQKPQTLLNQMQSMLRCLQIPSLCWFGLVICASTNPFVD